MTTNDYNNPDMNKHAVLEGSDADSAPKPAVEFGASYDEQAQKLLEEYSKEEAKQMFRFIADDAEERCKILLRGNKEKNKRAIKGIVTSRLKGGDSLKTKLQSENGKKWLLEWFGEPDKDGKKQECLLEHPDMGDFVGLRIGLYLPGDVKEVAQRIKDNCTVLHPFGTVRDPTRKAAALGNKELMRHDRGAWEEGSGPDDFTWEHYGYKSWQVVVAWDGKGAKAVKIPSLFFGRLRVEIQVGTVVTQAWAEVQHNIIYKQPEDIQITQTMRHMVDATNGMAITTDILLRELERSQKEAEEEAKERRQREMNRPILALLTYCLKGSHRAVARHLQGVGSEIALDALHGRGHTFLCIASMDGHTGVVRKLLHAGANVNVRCLDGETALHMACRYGHSDVVEQLLPTANVDLLNDNDDTALYQAVFRGHYNVVQKFRVAGVDLNAPMKNRNTALHVASSWGHLNVVKELLLAKVDLAIQNDNEETPLHVALQENHLEVIKELLPKADVMFQDMSGDTLLHLATRRNYLDVVKELLAKADVTTKNRAGDTALHIAARENYPEVVKVLLTKADVTTKSRAGETALHIAAKRNCLEVVKELLTKADVTTKSRAGETALHIAARRNYPEVVKELLTKGDLTTRNALGDTALHIAVRRNCLDVVKLLVFDQDTVAARDAIGNTALHLASEFGHRDVVKELRLAKAKITARNYVGQTAHDVAVKHHQNDVAALLREA